MRFRDTVFLWVALFCATFVCVEPVLAQDDADCPAPMVTRGPLEIFPAMGASGVALDAAVRVRYNEGFFETFTGDPSTLIAITNADTGADVPGSVEVLGDTLVFRPASPWTAGGLFDGVARGIDEDMNLSFIVGTTNDENAPVLSGTPEISASPVGATCETPAGYRIDVSFAPASDVDGARGDIEYLLFMTRAPRLLTPRLVARTRNFATDAITMAFVVDEAMAVGSICIALNVVDGVGHVVQSGETCSDPIEGSFFASCSATKGRPTRSAPFVVFGALSAVALLVRRKRAS